MKKGFQIVRTNSRGMELIEHGTALFPLDNVYDDFSIMDTVSWHWHFKLEMGIILRGTLQISIDTESYCLKERDAFFINSETLHTVFDKGHTGCVLRSIVFHPRLVGGSKDSIFFRAM